MIDPLRQNTPRNTPYILPDLAIVVNDSPIEALDSSLTLRKTEELLIPMADTPRNDSPFWVENQSGKSDYNEDFKIKLPPLSHSNEVDLTHTPHRAHTFFTFKLVIQVFKLIILFVGKTSRKGSYRQWWQIPS